MAMKKGYKRKPLRVTATKKSKAAAVEKVKVNNIKSIVKNVMKKTVERKFAMKNFIADKVAVPGCGLNYNGTTNLNGWCNGPTDGYGILPSIPAGSGEGSRIGVKITPKSCFLRYSLLASTTTDSTVTLNTNPYKGIPFRVRVIIFRHRYAIDDFAQNNIVNIGNGATDLTADVDTYFRPYNKDEYTIVYSKTHRMAALRHVTGAAGTTVTTENLPNGCMTYVNGRARVPLPKVLRYNDQVVTNYPTNIGYFLAFAVVNDDGSTVTTAQSRVMASAESGMYFTDL